MSNVKLSYFDFDGGRGEPARLALAIGGINLDDHRIPISDWPAYRDKTPFFAVPMITVDGTVFTQSSSINRYLGKRVGLYPTDDLQSLLCDEAMDAADDITTRIVQTMNLPDADKRRAREELQTGRLTRYLEQFQAKLIAAGGEYFADQRLTVADLKVFVLTRWLRTGVLDHIPKDFVDRVAPLLVRHLERVASHPGIAAYYQRRNAARLRSFEIDLYAHGSMFSRRGLNECKPQRLSLSIRRVRRRARRRRNASRDITRRKFGRYRSTRAQRQPGL